MSETNIDQNNQQHVDQDLKNDVDVSTGSKKQLGQQAGQDRKWGPGTPAYYKESWSSYGKTPSSPQIEEQQKAPEKLAGMKEFAQKVMKALNFKKGDALVEEEVVEETESVEKTDKENAVQLDNLAKSIGDKLDGIKLEAEKEYEQTKDPLTRTLIDITEQLEVELQKEHLNWNKVDLLVRQLAILLVQKMANNDQTTVQEEIKMMRKDIDSVRGTYNTKWELGLGIAMGAISMVGGFAGVGGGVAGMTGAVSQGFMTSIKGLSDGLSMISQGAGQPAQKYVGSLSESKRQLYNYELERDRSHKQTAESSLQGNKSMKGSQMSQRDRAIEAAYRALLQILQ
jgi:hypothetical protein